MPRPQTKSTPYRPSMLLRALVALLALLVCNGAGAVETKTAPAGWPEFRGPSGNGIIAPPGTEVGLPLQWSETENIKWKTAIPEKGWSTPVVLDGRVWLTTATPDGHDFFVISLNADTGEILSNDKLFHADNPEPLGNNVNSYASPSPALEPGRVYVHFGSYGTACLDATSGKVIWSRQDLPCRHYRGPGSSLIIFENLLILTFDGADLQYLTALDKLTGETVWKTDRTTKWLDLDEQGNPKREGDFRKAFSTPLVVDVGGKPQMLTAGSYAAYAYDPRTGEEIWKTHNDAYTPACRPVFGNGLAFMMTGRGNAQLWALRVDGTGDVTDTHVAWKLADPVVPDEPSPLLVDDLLYLVSNDGIATCLEAANGTRLWSERIGGNYEASPVFADGRIYFFNVQGKGTVLRAGRAFEILATNKLDAGLMASPAAAGKAFFLRTKTHLYRVEGNGPAAPRAEQAAGDAVGSE